VARVAHGATTPEETLQALELRAPVRLERGALPAAIFVGHFTLDAALET
jgi:hypothetical protein